MVLGQTELLKAEEVKIGLMVRMLMAMVELPTQPALKALTAYCQGNCPKPTVGVCATVETPGAVESTTLGLREGIAVKV